MSQPQPQVQASCCEGDQAAGEGGGWYLAAVHQCIRGRQNICSSWGGVHQHIRGYPRSTYAAKQEEG
jgi:hypothetical protein